MRIYMQAYYSMFISGTESDSTIDNCSNNFGVKKLFWSSEALKIEDLYQQIMFKVFRQPKQLPSHLQRIYFTYSHGMAEQLYAALVDLLWVLDGNGKALSHKMISASKSLLTEEQFGMLRNFIKQPDIILLTGNKFSIFCTGLVGTNTLVTKHEAVAIEQDPLILARDYVEYSQLDAAIQTLETGVVDIPDRQELQTELLELYKVTKNIKAYTKMRDLLIQKELNLSNEWQELDDYFTEMSNEK